MKKIFAVIVILFSTFIFSQSGKEIIEKNIELSGGLIQWKLLNTVRIQGKVSLGINENYPIKIFQARPNLTKTVLTIGKNEVPIHGYDGKKGYEMVFALNKLQTYDNYNPDSFDNDFIDFEKKGFSAQVIGKGMVDGKECYKVELTKNVNKTVYYFDTKTYMLLKEEKKDETLIYSDYRKVGKLLFPYKIESSSEKKDGDYVILISAIETNKAFPANTFKF